MSMSFRALTLFCISLVLVLSGSYNIYPQTQEEKEIEESPVKQKVTFINNLLNSYPLRVGNNYSQETKILLKSNGKLIIFTQYKSTTPCVTSREEIFLSDIDPNSISIIPRDNYLALILGCKATKGNCAQRFFRDSCNITFKPQDYLRNVNIITSMNRYNAEQIVKAINELIELNADSLSGKQNEIIINKNISSESIIRNNSESQSTVKDKKHSFTMDDVEVVKKPDDISNDEKSKRENRKDEDALIKELLEVLKKKKK
jgi:hypothetical protein